MGASKEEREGWQEGAEEEEEDLTKVAWGAGLSKLLDAKIPQFVFFCLGWACLGLPCYLITGSGSSKAVCRPTRSAVGRLALAREFGAVRGGARALMPYRGR